MALKEVVVRVRTRAQAERAKAFGFTTLLLERPLPGLRGVTSYTMRNGELWKGDRRVGTYASIRTGKDEQRLRGSRGIRVLEVRNWKIIPLENLIAAGGGPLWAVVSSPEEARAFASTLEHGVDGLVIELPSAKQAQEYRALLQPVASPLRLVAAKVTRVVPAGDGDRVCVDTTSLLGQREGLLVGNTGQGFFLVAAETAKNAFVAPRPFRVNAGALHAYVWNQDRTHYLSELAAGFLLHAVDARGRVRPVTVGRAKIERRPMVLVEARAGRYKAGLVLQNAETVRLVQPGGKAKSVTALAKGDAVLIYPETGARHFGMRVQESISER